ncbi:MAG: 4Fe-4S dicluster domain-containing protein [Desulfopila sp.]
MVFSTLLTLSVLICLLGLFLRFRIWFSQALHPPSTPSTPTERLSAGLRSCLNVIFSGNIIRLVYSFFTDLFFQKRIVQKSVLRWTAHTLIFFGFILLLLMHGMESVVSQKLFAGYESTLNPYLFLRNLFAVMVLLGIGIAAYRRLTYRNRRLVTYPSDWVALVLVGGIIFSGILLEGSRISSYTIFQEMVDEYGAFDQEETLALEAYWVADNGLSSPNISVPIDLDQIEAGREVNSTSCIECHAGNSSAFASFTLRGLTRPFAWLLGDQAAVTTFTLLHAAFCLAFLIWLPFGKMFHIVSAPVSLLINAIIGKGNPAEINLANRQMIGLSACTHCGACSLECSSGMFFAAFANDFILPSEKVQYLKKLAAGDTVDPSTRKRLQEGLYVCTSCDRCTDICPSGINLKEIFVSARYALLTDGAPEKTLLSHFSFPLALAQRYRGDHLLALKRVEEFFRKSLARFANLVQPLALTRNTEMGNLSYQSCYSCQRCTNICPVVRLYDNPMEVLGMLPHQLIYSLGIGNVELATGAQMIWSCSTCYLCQEHCPNQVELTDIFYSLKNRALKKIDSGDLS